ncbi:hypothetical protein STCU_08850 [Strigomonas culicis]|uniref:Uncharacterized protein n=1 Tax=Strigomonas culicis TaxID=28005 RepID=S9V1I4_9TRYP|nr:hypothetical protein STCU_08850 [Strigomonas culicis]|eukprot:EPY20756.1 hypothetical protein STCU_08850 [Strigomonas culicis]
MRLYPIYLLAAWLLLLLGLSAALDAHPGDGGAAPRPYAYGHQPPPPPPPADSLLPAAATLDLFVDSVAVLNAPLQWPPPPLPTASLAAALPPPPPFLNESDVVPLWAAAARRGAGAALTGLTTFPAALAHHAQQQHARLWRAAEAPGWYAAGSSCTQQAGCPYTAMAHASGTFTFSHLLTYHSFVRYDALTAPGGGSGDGAGPAREDDANAFSLSLKLSLCCNYLFHGALLRNATLYDHFLTILLEASPFHVLTMEEKRLLLPRARAVLLRTSLEYTHLAADAEEGVRLQNSHRDRWSREAPPLYDVFDHAYAAGSHPTNADGDGNVLLLFTGRVPRAGMDRVRDVLRAARAASAADSEAAASDPMTGRHKTNVDSTSHLADTGIQLKITNAVLKCKCPHTLLVMPQLRMTTDGLPPLRLVGAGTHCGVRPAAGATRHFLVRVRAGPAANASAVSSNHLLPPMYARVHNVSDYDFATSFALTPAPPPSAQVTWVVHRLLAAPPRNATRGLGRLPRVEVLRHERVLPAVLDPLRPQALLADDGAAPYFTVAPNTYYHVQVTVRRGNEVAPQVLQGIFLLRLPFPRHWPLPPVRPQPHFGVTRRLALWTNATLGQAEVRAGLDPRYGRPQPRAAAALDYQGYWQNTPDAAAAPLPVPYNPFLAGGQPSEGAAVELHPGRNILTYFAQDADGVCDPVALETREVWSVQARLVTPSPATACTDRAEVEAHVVRRLLRDMRQCHGRFAVNLPATRWVAAEAVEGREGHFRCRVRRAGRAGAPIAYDGHCVSTPTLEGGVSGTTAALHVPSRGVYDVDWLLLVAVRNASLVTAENLDPARARVVGTTVVTDEASGRAVNETHIEIRSSLLHIVRRVPRYPARVAVDLPMHYRRWQLAPPPPEPGSSRGDTATPATGYWVARRPLALLSVDERLEVQLDTHDVPNVRRTLPQGTLQYVAQDPGEELAVAPQLAYTARCPDMTVEYVVRVVALKAPPPLPAREALYTEESCLAVPAPRPARKDEAVTWHVPPCGAAARPPWLVEVPRDGAASDWRACGIEPYRPCEVVWTATNLVGAVSKTFSLHRCQRPPALLFHADGTQRAIGAPPEVYGPLPVIEELSAQPQGGAAARRRRVLPLVGYAATVGFSYNTTGPQRFFEVELAPAAGGRAANQLTHTQRLFVRRDDDVVAAALLWRAREYVDVAAAADGEDAEAFDQLFGYGGPGLTADRDAAALLPPVHWLEQRSRARRERDRAMDAAINRAFHLPLDAAARRVAAPVLHNSSLYPVDYTTRTAAGLREATSADRREFARRGLCAARTEHVALLALNPPRPRGGRRALRRRRLPAAAAAGRRGAALLRAALCLLPPRRAARALPLRLHLALRGPRRHPRGEAG